MRVAILVSGVLLVATPLRSSAGPSAPSPAPPRPVNLLTATPTVVAVSSTVANPKIVPEHLVDGDLGTASYESSAWRDHEPHVDHRELCHLVSPKRSAAIPPSLLVACESSSDPSDPSGGRPTRTSYTVHYHWVRDSYIKQ